MKITNVTFHNSYGTPWGITGPIDGFTVTNLVVAGTQVTSSNQSNYFSYKGIVSNPVLQTIFSGQVYTLVNQHSGNALDNNNTTKNGGKVVQWTPNGNNTQQWKITAVGSNYKLVSQRSGMALDNSSSGVAGFGMVQWTDNGGIQQQWQLISLGDGIFQVKSAQSSLNLDNNSSTTEGSQVVQWSVDNSAQQQWEIR